jgi:hypothetical protein
LPRRSPGASNRAIQWPISEPELESCPFLACRAGARRVYAIEAGESLEFARVLAARNGFLDRIEFINNRSTSLVLPERVKRDRG